MTAAAYNIEHWTTALAEPDYQRQIPRTITVNDRAATRQAIIRTVQQEKTAFIERSAWGAHKSKPDEMSNDWDYTKVALHHAGRSYSCGPAAAQLQKIQHLHMHEQKWPDIGYHYAIDCDGCIYEGRDIRFKGSHLDSYNTGVIGIVFLENLSLPEDSHDGLGYVLGALKSVGIGKEVIIPNGQRESAKKLISTLCSIFPISTLGGHQEFPKQNSKVARLCPGTLGMRLVNEIRAWSELAKP